MSHGFLLIREMLPDDLGAEPSAPAPVVRFSDGEVMLDFSPQPWSPRVYMGNGRVPRKLKKRMRKRAFASSWYSGVETYFAPSWRGYFRDPTP